MFVVSRRNIVLPGPDGERFKMPKDYMGPVPAWAEDSAYLKALAADGKVILSASGAYKAFAAKDKKPKKPKKPETPEAPAEEENTPEESAEQGNHQGDGPSGEN